jgi:hypothetical protein
MGTEKADARSARRARNRALGLCRNGASHGPAERASMCADCIEAHYRYMRQAYHRRTGSLLCANAPSHGEATCGALCAACRENQTKDKRKRRHRQKRSCVFGASHGMAIDGTYCAKCVARRMAAAARIAQSNEKARVARVSARVAATWKEDAPKPRKESLMQRIERGATIDTHNLWETLWRRM